MWTVWITIMHRLSNGYILFLRVSGYFHYNNNMTLFFLYNHLAQSLSVNADGCCFGFFWRKNHDTICPPKTVTLTFLWRCRFIFCQQLLEEGYTKWWWNGRICHFFKRNGPNFQNFANTFLSKLANNCNFLRQTTYLCFLLQKKIISLCDCTCKHIR